MEQQKRLLSGIQPSGTLHIGNYFGAIVQHVANQQAGNSFYFIANYHALTSLKDAAKLRAYTFDVAASYLALGLDPARATLFRQTDVPEVTELMWILMSVTNLGLLERAHSYKDKVSQGIEASAGLFTYPVLMAADILAYDSDLVPVGKDQKQHLEMTRDMARAFNAVYGETFRIPQDMLSETPEVLGIDGRKMSKSYDNTIPIFSTGNDLKKRVMAIKTDDKQLADVKNPETCNVFRTYSLFASPDERQAMAAKYLAGGYGYGHAKQELIAKIEETFADSRARRAQFDARPSDVEDILQEGAKKARSVARAVTDRARRACGLD